MASKLFRPWLRFYRVAKPFFTSGQRRQAVGLLAALVALLLMVAGLDVVNSFVGRDFMTAISERLPNRFIWLALVYLGVFAASTVVGGFARYTELYLGLQWRQWLTQRMVHHYLTGHAYYRVQLNQEIDNPDQRISQDLQTFTTTSLSFLIILLSSTIAVIAFAGVLWSITPWLLVAALVYPAVGTLLAVLIGHRLVGLNNLQLKKEADFRYELVRTREHADSLVLAQREPQQESALNARLRALVDNYHAIIAILRNLKFFSGGYNYLTQLIPLLIVVPLYMRGDIEFGVITQAAMAFSQVFNAFSLVVEQFQDISTFSAVVTRVATLAETIDEPPERHPSAIHVIHQPHRVAYQELSLTTPPDCRLLIADLNLEILPGKRLLITGPNGTGKSALFQATADVWQWGHGQIVRPAQRVMFLPQKPFLIFGTLRDQLSGALQHARVRDDQIINLLRGLKLDTVLARGNNFDLERDWASALSLGEQQLLAVARLLLAEPEFAFLDQATSALGERDRKNVYDRLSKSSITYISVGDHHPILLEYHDTLLDIKESGQWSTEPIEVAAAVTH